MANRIKTTIELTGNVTDVMSFIAMCAKVELLCAWGTSREIPLSIDGDGSADLKFKVMADVEEEGLIDLIQDWKKHHKDEFYKEVDQEILNKHYIGE